MTARPASRQKKKPRTRKPRERDVEKAYPRTQFVAKLRRLADALERGEAYTIRVAGESLRVPVDAVANIEHERAGTTHELEFQVKWTSR